MTTTTTVTTTICYFFLWCFLLFYKLTARPDKRTERLHCRNEWQHNEMTKTNEIFNDLFFSINLIDKHSRQQQDANERIAHLTMSPTAAAAWTACKAQTSKLQIFLLIFHVPRCPKWIRELCVWNATDQRGCRVIPQSLRAAKLSFRSIPGKPTLAQNWCDFQWNPLYFPIMTDFIGKKWLWKCHVARPYFAYSENDEGKEIFKRKQFYVVQSGVTLGTQIAHGIELVMSSVKSYECNLDG